MKAKLVNLKVDGNADAVLDILINYINKNSFGADNLISLVYNFDEEYGAVDIIDSYDNVGDGYDEREEWVEFEIFGMRYIFSYYPKEFNEYERMESKDEECYFYIYVGV